MSTLAELRAEVAEALETPEVPALSYVRENFTPPVVLVVPGNPYLSEPERFGADHTMRLLIVMITGAAADAETEADRMDLLIETTTTKLGEAEWDLERVSQPARVAVAGAEYLGAVAEIATAVSL